MTHTHTLPDATDAALSASQLQVHVGELYGKPDANGQLSSLYHVLAVHKQGITLQNVDNPLSQFDTTAEKLTQSGYVRLSQTPYINLQANITARGKAKSCKPHKAKRCPFTTDIFAERADSERPQWPENA